MTAEQPPDDIKPSLMPQQVTLNEYNDFLPALDSKCTNWVRYLEIGCGWE